MNGGVTYKDMEDRKAAAAERESLRAQLDTAVKQVSDLSRELGLRDAEIEAREAKCHELRRDLSRIDSLLTFKCGKGGSPSPLGPGVDIRRKIEELWDEHAAALQANRVARDLLEQMEARAVAAEARVKELEWALKSASERAASALEGKT